MAKMFYTLEEAAAKLGVGEAQIKQMAEDGQLQQFRDRDKLMFKREQVDELSEGGVSLEASESSGNTGFGDTIDLTEETSSLADSGTTTAAAATGISVFDTDEVALADPMAQTQVTNAPAAAEDSELTLESVGSGSGLLDLTHEPDETSLGAMALLDDIGGEDSDAKMSAGSGMDTGMGGSAAIGSSDTSLLDAIGSESDGLGQMEDDAEGGTVVVGGAYAYVEEERDPVGDAISGSILLGVFGVLIVALTVTITGMQGLVLKLTAFLAMDKAGTPEAKPDMSTLGMWSFVMFGTCFLLGIIGWFIGKSIKSRSGA